MKKLLIVFIISLSLGIFTSVKAQCVDFAEKIGLTLLNTEVYQHDGYLNSIVLESGEHIDVVKPFFKGRKYRIVVIADSKTFEYVNFKVINSNKIVIYNNKADAYTSIWEFIPQESENLIISVKVPDAKIGMSRACVAIITGVDSDY
ncbi:MAG: hypothetical protein KAI79_03690 [Bacteroidales bacterium]|nr:hypothetical protein [Bacteroidales bacterium]